jgi:hypothetical protein
MLPQELADGGKLPKPVLVLISDTFPRQTAPGGQSRPVLMNNRMDYEAVLRTAKPGYHLRLAGSLHPFSTDLGVLHLEPKPIAMPLASGAGTLELNPPVGMPPPPRSGRLELSPPAGMPPMSGAGSIDPARALSITKAYVQAFFDQYLRGKKSALLNGASPEYPEITFDGAAPDAR